MGWVASGVSVTLDWHVYADGAWRVETREIGSAAPVNVYVTPTLTAPVVYRHQAGECAGRCVLACGHPLSYGCDCETIAAEACQGDVRPVWRLVCTVCGDVRPDADVMGEGVSRGARCEFPVCEGAYRDVV